MVHIGLKIKDLVESKKITVIELSKVLGKSRQTVYNMYNEEDVSTEILKKINSELGIPISYFFDGVGNTGQTNDHKESMPKSESKTSDTKDDDSFWKEQMRVKDQIILDTVERLKRCEAALANTKNGGNVVYGS